jgi:hypothetical protein
MWVNTKDNMNILCLQHLIAILPSQSDAQGSSNTVHHYLLLSSNYN